MRRAGPALRALTRPGRQGRTGHSASYYWKATRGGAVLLRGALRLNALEMNAWLLHGGGLAPWREPARCIPVPSAGNTGTQMAWFIQPARSPLLADMKGLRMRIPGLGRRGDRAIGAILVSLPGAEIYNALQASAPSTRPGADRMRLNDVAFGLHVSTLLLPGLAGT